MWSTNERSFLIDAQQHDAVRESEHCVAKHVGDPRAELIEVGDHANVRDVAQAGNMFAIEVSWTGCPFRQRHRPGAASG